MSKKIKIGYTSGVFDMFHIGHLNILRRAKELCDFLIVGVTTDELCEKRKNKKPIINENDRIEIVSSIKYVDKVIKQTNMDKLSVVKEYGINIVFVGSDWKNSPEWNEYERQFSEYDCTVIYLDYTKGISSTILRNKLTK